MIEPDRIEYDVDGLLESNVDGDPFGQFARWFEQAVAASLVEANMMTLATVDEAGHPDARIVLLKDHGPGGFVFYTNYSSGKARHLAAHPVAALVFAWQPLHRQVRVWGSVDKVDAADSDRYFASRPRESQLAARASDQSMPISGRSALQDRYAAEEAAWVGRQVPRPETWGGFRLRPTRFEFWQGQLHRMHDRIVYSMNDGGWSITRLSP